MSKKWLIVFLVVIVGYGVLFYKYNTSINALEIANKFVNDADEKLEACKKECGVKYTTNIYPNFGIDEDNCIRIGLNYPETGPYSIQGRYQLWAAMLAVDEINKSGGILNKKVQLVIKDSMSKSDIAKINVRELIDDYNCQMIFGGSASSVAIAGGEIAKLKKKLYFGTLTYSNATTGRIPDKECKDQNDDCMSNRYMFRECYNAWMGAKVLSKHLLENYHNKVYFYITADYTWGKTTEESIRQHSKTSDDLIHKSVKTPFPGATQNDFIKALKEAEKNNPDVLVLVLFGKDMAKALTIAHEMGLKSKVEAIIVPNLTLGMIMSAGPQVMEGVIGALPWNWKIPFIYNYENGKKFVFNYLNKYGTLPSTSAASAYNILYQYKDAVERTKSFDTEMLINALEGHSFVGLKDIQQWRKFDHQCIQTVYAIKCKNNQKPEYIKEKINILHGDQTVYEIECKLNQKAEYPEGILNILYGDVFEIIDKMHDDAAARKWYQWVNRVGE